MKFLKGIFPSGKKTVGFVLMAAAGVLVLNIVNRKFNIEGRIANALPETPADNMRRTG